MALELQQQAGQFLVGTAAPRMEQVQNDGASGRAALIEGLLRTGIPGIEATMQKARANQVVQGALDASNTTQALEQKDAKVKEQNTFYKDAYEEGYLSAALNKDLSNFRAEGLRQVQDAVEAGMDIKQYDEMQQQRNQEYSAKVSQYLPHTTKEQALAILGDLQETSLSNRNKFIKDSAAAATVRADRALDENLTTTGVEFYQYADSGEMQSAAGSVAKGLRSINTAPHLDKDAKVARAKQFMRGVAQQTDSPELIDMMQQVVSQEMGITLAPDVTAALFKEWNRAGSQQEAKVTAELEASVSNLAELPPDLQVQASNSIRDQLETQAQRGVISAGTMRGYMSRLTEQQKVARKGYALDTSIQKYQPVAGIAAATGLSQEQAQAKLLARPEFANTTAGNVNLLGYAEKSNDSKLAEVALNRASANAGATLAALDFTGKDGQVSQDAAQNIAAWMSIYTNSSNIGKQTLVQGLPERFRGVMQSAAISDPNNVGPLFDNLRRIAENEASGKYQNVSMRMPPEMVKDVATEFSNWFSFGGESDAQRSRGIEAVQQSWRRLALNTPELMADPDTARKNAVADAMSRRVELELNEKAIHTYIPTGRTLKDYYGGYRGSAEQFTASLQSTIQGYLDTLPKENVDDIVVELGSAGGDANGVSISVFKDGIRSQTYAISGATIQDKANSDLEASIDAAAKDGRGMVGLAPATFANHTSNTVASTNVSGLNGSGVEPEEFASMTAALMRFEGFVGKKKGDTIGFGRHAKSGQPVPEEVSVDDAVAMLQSDLEREYIPTARRAASDAGVAMDTYNTAVLVDLSYHGGYGSASPVAEAMQGAVKLQGVSFDAKRRKVLNALQETPAYKQAQPERKQYLERGVNAWAQSNLI